MSNQCSFYLAKNVLFLKHSNGINGIKILCFSAMNNEYDGIISIYKGRNTISILDFNMIIEARFGQNTLQYIKNATFFTDSVITYNNLPIIAKLKCGSFYFDSKIKSNVFHAFTLLWKNSFKARVLTKLQFMKFETNFYH